MKRLQYAALGLLCFALGYIAASWNDQPSLTSPPPEHSLVSLATNNPVALLALDQDASDQPHSKDIQQQLKGQHLQLKRIIQQTSDQQLGQYLQQAFPNYSFAGIQNKQQFAQQMLDEFLQAKNDPQQRLAGQAYVTDQSQTDVDQVLPREIYVTQPLYAHFDTMGKVPNNMQVMVRWTHRDSGEVLLFTPRKVSEQQQQNWVSFYPMTGWKTGHYDVKYYQMNDQLSPIAQTSFYIQHVIE